MYILFFRSAARAGGKDERKVRTEWSGVPISKGVQFSLGGSGWKSNVVR